MEFKTTFIFTVLSKDYSSISYITAEYPRRYNYDTLEVIDLVDRTFVRHAANEEPFYHEVSNDEVGLMLKVLGLSQHTWVYPTMYYKATPRVLIEVPYLMDWHMVNKYTRATRYDWVVDHNHGWLLQAETGEVLGTLK